jgi:hypothetical protein
MARGLFVSGCGPKGGRLHKRLFVAAVLVALEGRPGLAEGPQRRLADTLGVSVNPIGLQDQLTVSWRWGLSASKNPFLSDAHVAVGVSNNFSPAYERFEMWAELSPLSVLDLKAGLEPVFYFGTFGHLVGFPSYDADFGKDEREAIKDQAVSRTGIRYHLSPTFKIKIGRVVARTGAEFEWWRVDGPGAFFYEPMRDTLLDSEGDALMTLSSQVFYEFPSDPGGRKILAGLFHDRIDVHDAPQNLRERLGPIAVWTLGDRRFGVREPTVIASVYSHLQDRSKDGELGGFVALSFAVGR